MLNTFRPVRSTPALWNGASGAPDFTRRRKSCRTASMSSRWKSKGTQDLHEALVLANLNHRRCQCGRTMRSELVVVYIVVGAFTAALASLTHPTERSSLPTTFVSMSICFLWPFFLWPTLLALVPHRTATKPISPPTVGVLLGNDSAATLDLTSNDTTEVCG
jgi:hypothetical protein